MIPKIIHYCWFGHNNMPELAIKCIESWKRFLPDYEIKEWNESNFDINMIPYTKEAYKLKKYAFVSDYARFWILYHYGGLYFDTDVEVIRPIDDIILQGAFMGCENAIQKETTTLAVAHDLGCNPGLGLGCNPGLLFYKEMLDLYAKTPFLMNNGTLNLKTIVEYTTEQLSLHGLKNTNEIQHVTDIYIYPKEYFCPIDYRTNKCEITSNTRTIHHYVGSWQTPLSKIYHFLEIKLGKRITSNISIIIKRILGK